MPRGTRRAPKSSPRARSFLASVALACVVGGASGLASAVFLGLLEVVTTSRIDHPALVWALPFAGAGLGFAIERWGQRARGGAGLVIATAYEGGPRLPIAMTPLVLFGTLVTHLFGGSAGREGTAVQMGASLAEAIAHRVGASASVRKHALLAGIAGGFGSVFGTPLAGAVFGLEVLVFGEVELAALVPTTIAAFVGDRVTRAMGVEHMHFPTVPHAAWSAATVGAWVGFAVAIAIVSHAFVALTRLVKSLAERISSRAPLRLFCGGIVVLALWRVAGTDDYLGLGVPTIVRAFRDHDLPHGAFAWKLVFTAVTVGAGFVGGEVTPLFFVGATLGAVVAPALGLPAALGAGVGMAAMFSACANTPIALAIMAAEVLGEHVLVPALFVCALATALSPSRGIYPTQRPVRFKLARLLSLSRA